MKPQNRSWPFADARYDWCVTLPSNALIVNINVFRPANAGGSAAYTLHVGNGDKSVVYGTDGGGISASAARSIIVQYDVANLLSAGVSNPHNQVRVWADPTTSYAGAMGGYFIVQYY